MSETRPMSDPTEVEKAKRVMAQCIEDIICRGEVSMLSRAVDMLIAAERRDARKDGHVAGCECGTFTGQDGMVTELPDPSCIEWREK